DSLLEGRSFDAVIVGGGVIGCAVARELSRQNISIALLEKESDLAMQASGRNDGMIHPGFAASPGTLKASFNVRGNRMYTKLAEELDFELKRPGSIILFKSSLMNLLKPIFRRRCRKNGVDGHYRGLSVEEVRKMEPYVTENQKGGFFLPSAGIVSPFSVTIALAENAAQNGAEIFLSTAVTGMDVKDGRISRIQTNRGSLQCGVLINAAGIWADKLSEMVGDRFFSLHGRKGTDAILDIECSFYQNHILGMPSILGSKRNHSKGGGLVPCVEGNILIGPTSEEVPGREDYSTDSENFRKLLGQLSINKELKPVHIINYYSGVRAASWEEDFIIEPSGKISNLILAAAIQSPGLASAPAIGEDVARMAVESLRAAGVRVIKKKNFNPRRKAIPAVKDLSPEERSALIRKDPAYGEILCRCEEVSRGEIRDALVSSVPASTVDGIKRRVRAGAGRCHGGFCLPRVIMVMAEELGIPITNITRKGGNSRILLYETKEDVSDETGI
ncbi:MAG: NAD(P)/FAD-dependent oxidoreductase, partial [Spirochaetales bacterium]|nr:NAD(P)/FAD-dependent oxidoreductase [Spirochaetales bacterium]